MRRESTDSYCAETLCRKRDFERGPAHGHSGEMRPRPGTAFVWTQVLEWGDFADLKNEAYVKDLPLAKATSPEVLLAANYDAWRALPEDYDELWVPGDLVNYGPQLAEVVSEVMERASLVVQGNHDYAVGYEDDSLWTPRYRAIAEASRRFTSSALSDAQKTYLRNLPVQVATERCGRRFTSIMRCRRIRSRAVARPRGSNGSKRWRRPQRTSFSSDILMCHSFGERREGPDESWKRGPTSKWRITCQLRSPVGWRIRTEDIPVFGM